MLTNRNTTSRYLAATLAGLLLAETFLPTVSFALTSGPTQPEFSGFEPVATTNMVNDFTGSFSYNLPVISIPGPNGMGYALSLSYQNATSVEEEASWVGLGWTLNPGSIGRIKRGFPDEYKGADVEYWNKVRDNWTASVKKRLGVEAWSGDVSAGAETTQRYNNYTGYGYISGVSLGVLGVADVSFTEADGKSSWGFKISPINLLDRLQNGKRDHSKNNEKDKPWAERFEKSLDKALNTFATAPYLRSEGGLFGLLSFNDYTLPTSTSFYNGTSWDVAISGQGDPLPDIGLEAGISGYYAMQKSVPKYTRHAYGYMYSGTAARATGGEGEKVMMDYYTEKDAPFNKRDRFLGIPFSNADNFIVSGEGLSGSFHLHQRRPGHFRPSWAKSTTDMFHVNLDFHFGVDFGAGVNLGYGHHYTEVKRWLDNPSLQFVDPSEGNEPYFFRFTDDMGGDVSYATDDNPVRSNPAFDNGKPSGIWENANDGKRTGRSAYIGFNTNDRLNYHPPLHCWDGAVNDGMDLRGYAKEKSGGEDAHRISRFINRNTVGNDVGEFAVTKEDGSIYVYGLPVYAREEAEFQFGVQGLGYDKIKENFIAYRYGEPSESVDYSVVGEVRKTPYPSMYLLTEILSPDYIDRNNDGPTPDDLGGYVRFDYDRKAGGNDKKGSLSDWYRWRTPYKGLNYQKNSLSDPYDDVGTVQSGYKEVYYLKSIETRTHKALFYTSARRDGYPAETSEYNAATSPTSSAAGLPGSKQLYKLDRIRLYAKDGRDSLSTLLTTVNFQYDYTLCQGLPNSEMEGSKRLGKLTLKKVWFEHEGVFGVKVSPYEFGYEYHTSDFYPPEIATRYPDIVNYGSTWTSGPGSEQNPDYSPFDIDRWGNYQYHGKDRHSRFIPWVDQTPDMAAFDPAAWQLKWIKLPSGGEIQVQYEQNRYRYVEHKEAMAMVSLIPGDPEDVNAGKFRLDLSNLGSDYAGSAPARDSLIQAIRKRYIENGEYIYFKLLYALQGDNVDLDRCSSEFITGYASVSDVQEVSGEIEITLDDAGDYTLPKDVCMDFVRTQRAGIIQTGTSCDPSKVGIPQASDQKSAIGLLWDLFSSFGDAYVDDGETCKHINYENSWLRIPMTRAKLGGGIRVKRLLMYDAGLEGTGAEDAALYGTEYLYETEDGQSSGVATNEPVIGREENPLVGLVDKRESKSEAEPIISVAALGVKFSENGREQFEGPIGESIMPGASVGYSRVVVRNIHQGKTGTGHLIEEFYTSKDYPFDLQYSSSPSDAVRGLKTDMTSVEGPPLTEASIGGGVASYTQTNLWRTQGFRFVLNSMNGKPKSATKYSGEYKSRNAGVVEQTRYDYYEPGELLPVMYGPAMADIRMESLGKEMEVVLADRTVEDVTNDYGIESDWGAFLGFLLPVPFGSIQGSFNRHESVMSTHMTTKIIRYPAVQKRVTVTKDGITDMTEYIGFDPKSGKAVLTRSYDGYHQVATGVPTTTRDGSYYSVALPAWRYYPAMGQIAERQGQTFGSTDNYTVEKRYDGTKHYLLVNFLHPVSGSTPLDLLAPGDLVEVKGLGGGTAYDRLGVYHIGTIAGNQIELLPASYSLVNDYPVRTGVVIDVLRVANTNQLTTNAGSFTTYGKEPTKH